VGGVDYDIEHSFLSYFLPKLAGKKQYLFVAIDRATRVLYFEIYENKTAINAVEFLNNCKWHSVNAKTHQSAIYITPIGIWHAGNNTIS
jgi:hypothetical protein